MATQKSSKKHEETSDTESSSERKETTKGIRRDLQSMDAGISKAMQHLMHGIADGIDEYVRRRDLSAKRKKDGALRDFDLNVARAVSKASEPLTKVPKDVLRASLRMRRTLCKGLRSVERDEDD